MSSLCGNGINNYFGIIGAQKRKIARFAEVDLDRRKFILKINISDPGCFDQLTQLLR